MLPILCKTVYTETKAEGILSVFAVALLTEGVDRNRMLGGYAKGGVVALLTEGVDRNFKENCIHKLYGTRVALLTEGVDRNTVKVLGVTLIAGRPPHGGRG